MDIVTSIENSVIMSKLSLKELNEQKVSINKIYNENEKLNHTLSISEKIIDTFYSFYNTLKYKVVSNFYNKNEITKKNNNSNIDILSQPKKIKKNYSDSILYNLNLLKENNITISKELDDQNQKLNLLYLNLETNEKKIKNLNKKL
jgi:hypothetical protein